MPILLIRWYIFSKLYTCIKSLRKRMRSTQFNIIYFPSFCDYFFPIGVSIVYTYFSILSAHFAISISINRMEMWQNRFRFARVCVFDVIFFVLHIDIKVILAVYAECCMCYYLTLEQGTRSWKPRNRIAKVEKEGGSQLKRYWERKSKRMREMENEWCEWVSEEEEEKNGRKMAIQ